MLFLIVVSILVCFIVSMVLRIYTRDNIISYVGTYVIGIFIILVGQFISVSATGEAILVEVFLLVFPAVLGSVGAHVTYNYLKPKLRAYLESKMD